jgi:glutamine---fructose-6-phosphate transaminase (isomerizing)
MHLMYKEIFEQPEALGRVLEGRIDLITGLVGLKELDRIEEKLKYAERIIIAGCGTARHAGIIGKYLIEEIAGLPVEVDYAPEFLIRKAPLFDSDIMIAVSQSGETADTLAAVQKVKKQGLVTIGIVNAEKSSIARAVSACIYAKSGDEKAIASTKAFSAQAATFGLFALKLKQLRDGVRSSDKKYVKDFSRLKHLVEAALKTDKAVLRIAKKYCGYKNFAYLGAKYSYPLALEGALKLKEVSYAHAEGYPAGEFLHGPVAMIDKNFPIVFIIPSDNEFVANFKLAKEFKRRGARIIAIATEGEARLKGIAAEFVYVPRAGEILNSILFAIPLQLLAYHFAIELGRNADKPRGLTKSVK